MKKSLIEGLKEKDMQAVVNSYNLNDFYFPTLFPLKFTPTLTWKALEAQLGVPVAADVVSWDATAPRKTRNVVGRNQGDIPKIDIAREKGESELNEYFQLKHYAKSSDGAQALLDFIYDDVEFCFKGVNARLEWLALRALSLGKIILTQQNNEGIVTEAAVDFLVPDAQKGGVANLWNDPAAAKPIRDIKLRVKAAKGKGFKLKYMYMNQETFENMAATEEVIKACATWVLQATNLTETPSVEGVNRFLKGKNLPEVKIIDAQVTIEIKGEQTVVDPWENGVVTFVPEMVCGNTWYAPLADEQVESSVAVKAKRTHVLIKKFSVEEPLKEVTKGSANSFPAWASANRSFLMNTLDAGWNK